MSPQRNEAPQTPEDPIDQATGAFESVPPTEEMPADGGATGAYQVPPANAPEAGATGVYVPEGTGGPRAEAPPQRGSADAGATGVYLPEVTGAPRTPVPPQDTSTGTYPGPMQPPPGDVTDAGATGAFLEPGQEAPEPTEEAGATGAYQVGKDGEGAPAGPPAEGGPTSGADKQPTLLPGTPGRFILKQFHARGGMGEIWMAEDQAIGRVVALKRMRSGREHQVGRFVLEAQITGQLEHPSVLPIHELGLGEDGQPYYVMKFVRGRTLRDALAAYHAADGKDGEPREVQWLRLLQAFVSLCQAVAYAHSRGVIHRDIKPENVMIGSYGETLVLDWGLAKVVGQTENPEQDSGVHLSGMSTQTIAGSALGSPAYMAPEMADGRPELIDQASDVYLLGATLYEVLAGKPPRQGRNLTELLNLARKTPPVPPRKVDPRVPRALDAICMKAMAQRKEDRYAGAMALAEDTQRYLAGEPVLAYPEPLLERASRWVKRHRRGLATAAAVMVVVTAAAFGAKKLREYDLARREAERQAADSRRRDEAQVQVADFRRLADEMRYYVASSDPVAEQAPYFDPAKGEAAGEAALAVANGWGPNFDGLPLEKEREPLKADLYDLLLMMAENRSRQQAKPEAARDALVLLDRAAALEPPTRGYHRLRSYWLRAVGQDQQAQEEGQRADDPAVKATALDHFLLGEQYRTQATRLNVARAAEKAQAFDPDMMARALEQYRKALQLDPSHFWSHFQLGRCYLALGKYPEAVEALGACVALKPNAAWGYSMRGFTLSLLKRYDDAEADLNRALELDPKAVPAVLNRGVVYRAEGKEAKALADFAAVLQEPPDRRLIEAAYYRGQLYQNRGDHEKGAARRQDYEKARADFDLVVKENPSFRPAYLFRAQVRLALGEGAQALEDLNAYLAEGKSFDPESAKALEQRGRQLRYLLPHIPPPGQQQALQLALADLQKAADRPGSSPGLFLDLGGVYEQMGRADDALQAYTRGLKLASDDAKLLVARGWLLANLNRVAGARADFAAAVHADPSFSEAHTGLGYAEALRKTPDAASREADLALLYGSGDYVMLHNVACIHAALAERDDSHAKEHQDVALALLRRAVELWKRGGGAGPNEIEQIKNEPAFKPGLERRPEFKELLQEKAP